MLLVRSFQFSIDTDFTGALVDRVLSTIDASVPVTAYLEDRTHSKVSAAARALKKHAVLAAHEVPDRSPRTFVAPLDFPTAQAIANGIPKSLPFMYSHFIVGPVPELFLRDGDPPAPRVDSHPGMRDCLGCVVVRSSWWTSRRSLSLEAHVALAPPARDVAKIPPLPEATRRTLDGLGRVHAEVQELYPDDTESTATREAEPAAEALIASFPLDRVELPHPDLADDRWHAEGEAFGSFKDELRAVLPAYRYQSKLGTRGVWVLGKRTAAHNELLLVVDRGPIGGNARAWFKIRGPLWSHSFTLPVSRTAQELCVWTPPTLAAVCRNWAAGIAALERDVIPELERLYWPGFAWYAPGTR